MKIDLPPEPNSRPLGRTMRHHSQLRLCPETRPRAASGRLSLSSCRKTTFGCSKKLLLITPIPKVSYSKNKLMALSEESNLRPVLRWVWRVPPLYCRYTNKTKREQDWTVMKYWKHCLANWWSIMGDGIPTCANQETRSPHHTPSLPQVHISSSTNYRPWKTKSDDLVWGVEPQACVASFCARYTPPYCLYTNKTKRKWEGDMSPW